MRILETRRFLTQEEQGIVIREYHLTPATMPMASIELYFAMHVGRFLSLSLLFKYKQSELQGSVENCLCSGRPSVLPGIRVFPFRRDKLVSSFPGFFEKCFETCCKPVSRSII